MYDPSGSDTSREWIEIYNDTDSGIDFTTWKFFEGGTNHGITGYSGGLVIPSSGYAVVADNPVKFLEDYPSYLGVIYDSAFSLSNSGEHISLKQSSSGSEVDFADYVVSVGGSNDGSTLSKISGVWVRGSATPGSSNQTLLLDSDSSSSTSVSTTTTQATIAQTSAPLADVVLYLPLEKTVIAGADTTFSVFGLTRAGKNIDNLSYVWSYGDGGSGMGSTTIYRFAYPGRYIVSVEGTNGYISGVGRMSVRVISPEIAIAKIATGKYGTYIDIVNSNNYELDLSQWKLSINGSIFSFPKNTIVAGNSTTHMSGFAMGFASTTIKIGDNIKILFPTMEEVTSYIYQEENKSDIVIKKITQSKQEVSFGSQSSVVRAGGVPQKKSFGYVLGVATSTNKSNQTSTATKVTQIKNGKDTRLVTFFKSIFGNK